MKTLLFIVALVSVSVVWSLNRMTTARLRAEIELARQENAELPALQNERNRLRRQQAEAEERARREQAAAALARAQLELATRKSPAHRPPPTTLTVGEWLPIAAWKNRGQATPAAAVETALWAAAGGDVTALKELLQLDALTRAKADAILARLPEGSRATYANAEHLIAAFTTKSIPLGDAQLVWQHQPGPDEAVACVFVKNPDMNITPDAATSVPSGIPESRDEAIARARQRASLRGSDRVPPMAPPSDKTIATYLSLRRTDHGWRLIVPMSAVEKIAKELGGAR